MPRQETKFKVGDRVRALESSGGGSIVEGNYYVVAEDERDGDIKIKENEFGRPDGWGAKFFQPAPLFAVGDKVRFNTCAPAHTPRYTNATLTITNLLDDHNGEPCAELSGYSGGLVQFTTLASLEHATTDEEAVPIYDPRKDGWATASGKFRVEAKATERSATAGIGLTVKAPKFKVGDFLTLESWPEHGYKITKIDHEGVHLSTKDGAFSWAYPVDREWIVVKPSTTGFTIPNDEEALPPKIVKRRAKAPFVFDGGKLTINSARIGHVTAGILRISPICDIDLTNNRIIINDNCKKSPAIVALVTNGQPLPSTKPKVHRDSTKATKEADRLAVLHPGQEFGVFELVSKRVATVDIREAA